MAAPTHLLQIIVLLNAAGVRDASHHVRQLPGQDGLPEKLRYHRCTIGALDLVWEQHTEFCTYTFVSKAASGDTFSLAPFSSIDVGWLAAVPGEVIRASHLALIEAESAPDEGELREMFAADGLVCCELAGSAARLYSDFRLHPEGCGRLLLVDQGLQGSEAREVVQRVQELGSYRKMALLGLPVAQAGMAQLDGLEARLSGLTSAVADAESEDSSLLEELSALSSELAELTARTRYRMNASRAYGRIVNERLERLDISRVRGFPTLEDFTDRRLGPALRTCESFSERLDDLARRAERTSALLRTRTETRLAAQNRDLLASMDRRSSIQLRLQQTVEGLSILAISYYAVGLFAYAVKPLVGGSPTSELLVAGAVPAILLSSWLIMLGIKRRWRE